jgi:hypothetical protein
MICSHCPLDAHQICRGEQLKHFCRLVDLNDPIYTPAYVRILEHDDVETPWHPPEGWMPDESAGGGVVPCCGGAPLP